MRPIPALNAQTLPRPDEVGPIEPVQQRFYKVRKHLLSPEQHWHLICPGLSPNPRPEAECAGCHRMDLDPEFPRFELVTEGCRGHLLRAHDQHYAPAYRRAVVSAAGQGLMAFVMDKGELVVSAVGDEGVFIVLRRNTLGPQPWRVATAYRREFRSRSGRPPTNADFFQRAFSKWQKKTSSPAGTKQMCMNPSWSDAVAQELEPFLTRVEHDGLASLDVDEAAHLLTLLARADQPDLRESLAPLLRRALPHIPGLVALAPPESAEPLLTELKDVIASDDDPHGMLHDVLLELEDWLSVSTLLEHHAVALPAVANGDARRELVRLASQQLARAPQQVSQLAAWALARVHSLTTDEGPVELVSLWRAVAQADAAGARPVALPWNSRLEELGPRLRRLVDAIPLSALALPEVAHASSRVELGPTPLALYQWSGAVLELTSGPERKSLLLQVHGPAADTQPEGTRDDVPLTFTRDAFDAWVTEARPGLHRVTLGGETIEFTLTSV